MSDDDKAFRVEAMAMMARLTQIVGLLRSCSNDDLDQADSLIARAQQQVDAWMASLDESAR